MNFIAPGWSKEVRFDNFPMHLNLLKPYDIHIEKTETEPFWKWFRFCLATNLYFTVTLHIEEAMSNIQPHPYKAAELPECECFHPPVGGSPIME